MTDQFFNISLKKNKRYSAYIRKNDFSVIFADREKNKNDFSCERLFSNNKEELKRKQIKSDNLSEEKKLVVYLSITENCNLNCTYCDVLDKIPNKTNRCSMDWETAEKAIKIIFNQIKDNGEKAQIVFFGGEPLVNWDLLVKICEYLLQFDFNTHIKKMLVTNGTLINLEKAKFLEKHKIYTVVSLDGSKKVNDTARIIHQGKGSYAKIIKGIKNINKVMPGKLGISCTVGSHNAKNLANEIEFMFDQFNPCCIGINMYHYLSNGAIPVEINNELLIDSFLKTFDIAREKGIAIYQFIGILKSFIKKEQNRDYCPACSNKLLFTPDGRIGRCETMVYYDDYSIPIEYFEKDGFSKKLDWSLFTPEHNVRCKNCPAIWICPGGCVYDQFIKTGFLNGVEERRCQFYLNFFQKLLDLLLDSMKSENITGEYLIPEQRHFDSVAGKIPMTFPANTV